MYVIIFMQREGEFVMYVEIDLEQRLITNAEIKSLNGEVKSNWFDINIGSKPQLIFYNKDNGKYYMDISNGYQVNIKGKNTLRCLFKEIERIRDIDNGKRFIRCTRLSSIFDGFKLAYVLYTKIENDTIYLMDKNGIKNIIEKTNLMSFEDGCNRVYKKVYSIISLGGLPALTYIEEENFLKYLNVNQKDDIL